MIFTIRDDDTNFFTTPEELLTVYGRIWDQCPVSLSVVPFHACTPSKGIPRQYWHGDHTFPVGDNKDLIVFLKQMIQAGRVCITMHGYHHKDEEDGPEFVAGRDLSSKVIKGKRYLEQLFGTPIQVFVPPHNALSFEGWKAVTDSRLSLSGGLSARKRGIRLSDFPDVVLSKISKRRAWCRPRVCRGHVEFGYATLSPSADLKSVIERLSMCRGPSDFFCLATHYWELPHHHNNENAVLRDMLHDLLARAKSISGVQFTSLNTAVNVFSKGS
ncbi:hypothetical protein MELA_01139 [Candidatus Methylomirabilis lanthanidiphila]|uniref:DUF2334 domain-containing protein n=1 Tax=Candidatus Methylomirabilis lanthanidiphila TaxID=2211376 RepID=A0A564ZHJ3_9BACT|nr:DUF2334 domain-containing protein [Candidatus Methylomirabilis lanthanidiphila]VUZ84765.1 hypothetical protein MELA_01139 [Candidatus Methylomirabilis lanthanidiphila]